MPPTYSRNSRNSRYSRYSRYSSTYATHATHATHAITLHQPTQLTIYVCMYIYIYTHTHTHTHTYIHTHIVEGSHLANHRPRCWSRMNSDMQLEAMPLRYRHQQFRQRCHLLRHSQKSVLLMCCSCVANVLPSPQTFSKVSTPVNLLYKNTIERNFEKIPL
jgi:hypothetical protein